MGNFEINKEIIELYDSIVIKRIVDNDVAYVKPLTVTAVQFCQSNDIDYAAKNWSYDSNENKICYTVYLTAHDMVAIKRQLNINFKFKYISLLTVPAYSHIPRHIDKSGDRVQILNYTISGRDSITKFYYDNSTMELHGIGKHQFKATSVEHEATAGHEDMKIIQVIL